MSLKLRIATGVACLSSVLFSQRVLATDLSNSITGSVSDGSVTIPYRLFEPEGVEPGQKVPLVLFLHGMGNRGTDNVAQTQWMSELAQHTRSGQYAAYVLAPQIDTNMWFSWGKDETEGMSLTVMALKQAMNDPHVDTSRIYVTGTSMGGFGTWDILTREPNTFAAAVPMSGGGDPSTASVIKDTPIWAFHGSVDSVVPVQMTRDMIQAVRDAGGSPLYTEVEGGDHVIWPQIYADENNTLYSWLFSQHLPGAGDPTVIDPGVGTTPVLPTDSTPEPSSVGLLALVGMGLLRRGRRKN